MIRKVKGPFLYGFIFAIAVGAPGTMLIKRAGRPSQTVSGSPTDSDSPTVSSSANEATDAAFRDGLYQGKLAAERGREPRPSSGYGRWHSDQDLASFVAGYQQGYAQALAAKPQQSH